VPERNRTELVCLAALSKNRSNIAKVYEAIPERAKGKLIFDFLLKIGAYENVPDFMELAKKVGSLEKATQKVEYDKLNKTDRILLDNETPEARENAFYEAYSAFMKKSDDYKKNCFCMQRNEKEDIYRLSQIPKYYRSDRICELAVKARDKDLILIPRAILSEKFINLAFNDNGETLKKPCDGFYRMKDVFTMLCCARGMAADEIHPSFFDGAQVNTSVWDIEKVRTKIFKTMRELTSQVPSPEAHGRVLEIIDTAWDLITRKKTSDKLKANSADSLDSLENETLFKAKVLDAALLCEKVNLGEDISKYDNHFKKIMQEIKEIDIDPRLKHGVVYEALLKTCPGEWISDTLDVLDSIKLTDLPPITVYQMNKSGIVAQERSSESSDSPSSPEFSINTGGTNIKISNQRLYINGKMAYDGDYPLVIKGTNTSFDSTLEAITVGNTKIEAKNGVVKVNGVAPKFAPLQQR
jgi:hypothetical protein